MNKKSLLVISSILLAILGIIIVFYLTNLLRIKNVQLDLEENKIVLDRKAECLKLGERKYKEENKIEIESNYFRPVYSLPKYNFNEKLNTCLYSGHYYDDSTKTSRSYVIDLYTKSIILLSHYNNGSLVDGISSEKFIEKEGELMNVY